MPLNDHDIGSGVRRKGRESVLRFLSVKALFAFDEIYLAFVFDGVIVSNLLVIVVAIIVAAFAMAILMQKF